MKLGLIGNYGATNVGDDAILTALIKQFSGHDITVFSANPARTESRFGVKSAPLFPLGFRSFLKGRFYPFIKALKEVDAVILGGGGLFQDDRLYACFLWAWQVFWVKRLKKPLFIYATGVGPLKTKIAKRLTRFAYRYASVVSVRDTYSHDLLIKLGFPEKRIHLTADPAFSYKIIEKNEPRKQRYLISLRPWLHYDASLINCFSKVLKKYSEQKNVELVFVGMQNIKESDQKIIEPLQKKLGGRLLIPRHFSDLLHEMQDAQLAIGMRYHFLIAAMLTKTPCLPISYSPKVDELFNGTPLWPYVISVKSLSPDKLSDYLEKALDHSDEMTGHLEARVDFLKNQIKKNEELLESFIKTVDPSFTE